MSAAPICSVVVRSKPTALPRTDALLYQLADADRAQQCEGARLSLYASMERAGRREAALQRLCAELEQELIAAGLSPAGIVGHHIEAL